MAEAIVLPAAAILSFLFVAFLVFFVLSRPDNPKLCPNCKTETSNSKILKTFNQSISGQWTCPNCSSEVDRTGKVINNK